MSLNNHINDLMKQAEAKFNENIEKITDEKLKRELKKTFEQAKKGEMTIEKFNKRKEIWLSNLDK
jgi:hypothetical protein